MAIFTHDIRHTGFPQVDGGQRDPREMGRHSFPVEVVFAIFLHGNLKNLSTTTNTESIPH